MVSVETKKKELAGNCAKKGRESHPHGRPEEVEADAFPSLATGTGIP